MADTNKNNALDTLTPEQRAHFSAAITAYAAGIKHFSTIAVAEEEGAKRGKSEARKAVYGPLKERLEAEFARIHEEFKAEASKASK